MQWASVVEHLVSSIIGSKQPSSNGRSIKCMHLSGQAELTSSSRFIFEKKETSEPGIDILKEADCKMSVETSAGSHQEGRSSVTMVIRSHRRVEFHRRAEEHQSVIIIDYPFLNNPHLTTQMTSDECRHDIGRRVSSNIRQLKSSSGDPAHQWIIPFCVSL